MSIEEDEGHVTRGGYRHYIEADAWRRGRDGRKDVAVDGFFFRAVFRTTARLIAAWIRWDYSLYKKFPLNVIFYEHV